MSIRWAWLRGLPGEVLMVWKDTVHGLPEYVYQKNTTTENKKKENDEEWQKSRLGVTFHVIKGLFLF